MTGGTETASADRYDERDDSFKCWELAINAIREKLVRSQAVSPSNPTEKQWAEQGVVPVREMACVRRA